MTVYAHPDALAQDKDVDLVVCSVRVDKHYSTLLPSIQAGKDVYVEWPLAINAKEAKLMAEAAQKSGSRTLVGLQGAVEPSIVRIRQLIEDGTIGEIRSAEVVSPQIPLTKIPEVYSYLADKKVRILGIS